MSTRFELPEWLPAEPAPILPPVDDHRLEGLVNHFIAGKQQALFTAPDAFYRRQGGDAVAGAPAIADRLQALRLATLDQARDDGERAALGPRLDLHVADAMDGIDRHVAAQRTVHQRQVLAERQRLIRRAAELEPDNDDKIDGLAEAQASAAQALARLDGIAPDSPDDAAVQANARSQILRAAIEQRIGAAMPDKAVTLYDRVKAALSPADRRALELPLGVATDEAATDAWLTREAGRDGPPLADRAGLDDTLSDPQRLILRAKIGARESAEESRRFATVKGLDDQLAAATATLATRPALYRPGTLARLAESYADAGAPEKADETRRLALWERYSLPFTQAGAAAQQRHLEELTGPERAMAEAILRHQDDTFARDPYAAGTALYPDVGPPLPEEDAEGRLRQVRMIEAMRGMPASPNATATTTNEQIDTAPLTGPNLPERDRVQNTDPNLLLAADKPGPTPLPNSDEQNVEPAQAPSKQSPSARPPGSPQLPTVQARPQSRQEQAAVNRKEIDRLAGKPASDYRSEESFPADWEKRLPQATLDAITREANAFKVPPELLARIMGKESKFKERAGEGTKNWGQGIAGHSDDSMGQLVKNRLEAAQRDPGNGAKWGELERAVGRKWGNARMEAVPSVSMAAEYLRYLYDTTGHSWPVAVASYTKGPTVIAAFLRGDRTTKSIPDWGHVQAYLGKVFDGNAKRFDAYQ